MMDWGRLSCAVWDFTSILCLFPLVALGNALPHCDNQKCLLSLPVDVHRGKIHPPENRCLNLLSTNVAVTTPILENGGGSETPRSQNEDSTPRCMDILLCVHGAPLPGPPLRPPAAWPPAQHRGETDSAGDRHACVGPPIHPHTDTPTSPVQLASKLYLLFS